MNIISFDVEATGLLGDKLPVRITQLAYSYYRPNKEPVHKSVYIKPVIPQREITLYEHGEFHATESGYVAKMSKGASEVTGITDELLSTATPISKELLQKILKSFNKSVILTMNGLRYDFHVLVDEMIRFGAIQDQSEFNPVGIIDIRILDQYYRPESYPDSTEAIADLYDLSGYRDDLESLQKALINRLTYDNKLTVYEVAECFSRSSNIDMGIRDLYYRYNGNKLVDLYRYYVGGEFNAHDAGADVEAAYEVYLAMKEKYGFDDAKAIEIGFPVDPNKITIFSGGFLGSKYEGRNRYAVFAKGKNKDKPFYDFMCDGSRQSVSFAEWILSADFPWAFKEYIRRHKNGICPEGQELDKVFILPKFPEYAIISDTGIKVCKVGYGKYMQNGNEWLMWAKHDEHGRCIVDYVSNDWGDTLRNLELVSITENEYQDSKK